MDPVQVAVEPADRFDRDDLGKFVGMRGDDDTPGVLLNFYAQCGLEERLLLAFRTLKSPEQMPLVDLIEAMTSRA